MASLRKRARSVKVEIGEESSADGVFELSVTVGYLAADVNKEEIQNLERLLHDHCDAGVVALERGDLESHLHFQMVCQARVKSGHSFGTLVRKYMNCFGKKAMVPAGKVTCKVLTNRFIHTWKGMIGYFLKDSGANHFDVVMHNITEEEVIAGKTLHTIYGKADLKSRVCITNKNIGERAYVWFKYKEERQLAATMLSTLTDMIRNAMFVPAATWIIPFAGQGMDHRRMNSYWRCMTDPANISSAEVADVFIRRKEFMKGRYLDEYLNPVPKVNEEEYIFKGSPPPSTFDTPPGQQKKAAQKVPHALSVPPFRGASSVKQEVIARPVVGTAAKKLFGDMSKHVSVESKSLKFSDPLGDFIPLKDVAPLPTNVFLPTVQAMAGDVEKQQISESLSNINVKLKGKEVAAVDLAPHG